MNQQAPDKESPNQDDDMMTQSQQDNSGGPPNSPPSYLFDLLKQETDQLWQRSVILLTIFAGIFTSYGQIIGPFLISTSDTYSTLSPSHHFFAALIALVGIVFSCIWIAIGKGAYYWYNKYYLVLEYEYKKRNEKNEISYFNLPSIEVNNSLFSTSSGQYSVSRLQIFIGIVILGIWIIVFFTHTVQFVINDRGAWIKTLFDWQNTWITLIGMLIALVIICIVIFSFICQKYKWKGDYSIKTEKAIKKMGAEGTLTLENIKILIQNDEIYKKSPLNQEELKRESQDLFKKYSKK
ncbi:MAG: hypothetical protein ACRC0X_06630 [Brevinema sp.]